MAPLSAISITFTRKSYSTKYYSHGINPFGTKGGKVAPLMPCHPVNLRSSVEHNLWYVFSAEDFYKL